MSGEAGEVIGDGSRPLVIAIDGPSGSGKSTTARGVARRLDLAFLDTGAMYRAITWLVLHEGLDSTDEPAVARLAREAKLDINTDPDSPSMAANGHDVTAAIRDPDVSAAVSAIATNLDVRRELVDRQRQIIIAAPRGIVAEGRDITTVVAPDAQVRVLLVADPAERVARRHAELGEQIDADAVTDQVIRRDTDDSTVAQFHSAAPGVVVLDSTLLTLEQVIDAICALVPEWHGRHLDPAELAGAGEDVAR
ncbi:MAG TPA: (d)CMP kinase [Propionibacteriaceae bacterium]|nr:(d)CMP kinase [Propionibacteriaceae bacterium]